MVRVGSGDGRPVAVRRSLRRMNSADRQTDPSSCCHRQRRSAPSRVAAGYDCIVPAPEWSEFQSVGHTGHRRSRRRGRSRVLPLDPERTDLLYPLRRDEADRTIRAQLHNISCVLPCVVSSVLRPASNIITSHTAATAPSPAGLDLLLRPADWTGPLARLGSVWLFCARLGLIGSRVDLSDQGTPICSDIPALRGFRLITQPGLLPVSTSVVPHHSLLREADFRTSLGGAEIGGPIIDGLPRSGDLLKIGPPWTRYLLQPALVGSSGHSLVEYWYAVTTSPPSSRPT